MLAPVLFTLYLPLFASAVLLPRDDFCGVKTLLCCDSLNEFNRPDVQDLLVLIQINPFDPSINLVGCE